LEFLGLLDDYFKGAGNGAGGANGFTLSAPATEFCFHDSYFIINLHECATIAHLDTESTPVTLFPIYHGH
jgi:hypothetical protein